MKWSVICFICLLTIPGTNTQPYVHNCWHGNTEAERRRVDCPSRICGYTKGIECKQARKRAYRRWKGLKYFQDWLTDEIAAPYHEGLCESDFAQVGSVEPKILINESFWLVWSRESNDSIRIWLLSSIRTRQKWFEINRFSRTEVMDHFNQMLKKKRRRN